MDLHISADHVFIACGYTDMRKSIDGLSAIVYSLIETAKANDLDPERYLKYLFEKLPNTANFKDAETLDQYLPWAIKTQEKCKA